MAEVKFIDLTVDNLFDFCTVLDEIGAEQMLAAFDRDEIRAMTESGDNLKDIGVVVAMRIAGVVIRNMPKAREAICSFFAGCMVWDNGTAVTADEVKKFKIGQFAKLVHEFFQKDDLTDFFRDAAKFVGMGQSDSQSSPSADMAAAQNAI